MSKEKWCEKHNCSKNAVVFKNEIYWRCHKCTKDQVNDRRLPLKIKCINYKGGKCSICGYDKNISSMEFHHLDPSEKEGDIAILSKKSSTWTPLKNELDKCILLCANCHREVHNPSLNFDDLKTIYNSNIFFKEVDNTCLVCEKKFISNTVSNFCSTICRNSIKNNLNKKEVIKKYNEIKSIKGTGEFFHVSARTIREILRNN